MTFSILKNVDAGNMWWPAPAKLNLMLRILGRRNDGYHELQTVFQFVNFCDWINFKLRDDREIKLKTEMTEAVGDDNLVIKAARLIQNAAQSSKGVDITLDKRIPTGAGLGGGSSDAATTLLVLNRMFQAGLSLDELQKLGVALGADVPVFLVGENAWAEGVGEKLTKIELPARWFVILKPKCHISTGLIFNSKELTRDSKSITIDDFMQGAVVNDCLAAVTVEYPEVGQALSDMSVYASAGLTGTGACIFGGFASQESAYAAARELSVKWQVIVASSAGKSLLHNLLS